MQPITDRAVIAGGRGAQADHRHAQLYVDLDHAPMPGQPGAGQAVAGQRFGGVGGQVGVFGKGGFQQAIHRLLRQLVDDRLGKDLWPGGKAFPCPVAPPGDQAQRLFRRLPVPAVQPSQHMRRIRRRDAAQHQIGRASCRERV